MSQIFSKRWTTEPEYIELLNYLIEKTRNAKSPINIHEFVRDFKEKSRTALTDTCLESRIHRMRNIVHSFEHIETDTKVRMLFALSVSVNEDFLKKLSSVALVEVDGNNRITHYKSKSLELNGCHRLLTARDTKNYWTTDMECIELLNYLIEETENVKPPINLAQLARDFKEKSGALQTTGSLEQRIIQGRYIIHSFEHIDREEKVKLLFALSVPVNSMFLEELKKCAFVEVDEMNRITYYKGINDGLELSGDHSLPAKLKTVHLESKRSHRPSTAHRSSPCLSQMSHTILKRWTTDPEYIELLNYLITQTKDAKLPINIQQFIRDFKEKSGTALAESCLKSRIERMRKHIHSFEHIDTNTKIKLLFALSGSVDSDFLEELEKSAFVKVDKEKRITHYKANDGSLELRGDHSHSAKTENANLQSKRSLRSLIIDYCKNKNDADAVPMNEKEKEIWNLLEFITEECENTDSPLSIRPLAREFNEHFGTSRSFDCVHERIRTYCYEIHNIEFKDTHSKVKQLFCLGATLNSDYLERLRTEALVKTDEKNRITYYKATDGSLELQGDHSHSAKMMIATLESNRSHRSIIIDYFEKKNDPYAFPNFEEKKEIGNFIEFITEECEKVDSPLSIRQLTKDFNNQFGTARSLGFIHKRIKAYCREIETLEILNTFTKVEQLFCLRAILDSNFLNELRKDAVVEVDNLRRITKFIANNGRLILNSDLSSSAKGDGYSDNASEEYFIEEFDSQFDLNSYDNHLDEPEVLMEPSNEAVDIGDDIPVLSPTYMSMDDYFDFDPPTDRPYRSDEIEMREDEGNYFGIIGNAAGKTRKFETIPKSQACSSSSCTSKTSKRKVDATAGYTSSKRTKPPSEESMNSREMNDNFSYDDPPRIDLNPFRGPLGLLDEIEEDSDIEQMPVLYPEIIDYPTKEMYEEEAHSSG